MILTIKNRAGTEVLNRFSNYEALRFETDRIGGFITAEFEAKRDVLNVQADLQVYNQITIEEGASTPWEGYILVPVKASPVNLTVACVGWAGLLDEVPVTADQPSQKMSAFITAVLANPRISPFISAGVIDTGDYDAPPAITDIPPGKYCSNLLEDYNKWNDWRYYTTEGKKFNFGSPQTAAKWIVLAKDAPGFQIADSPANFWNEVVYKYTDGGGDHYSSVSDATSIAQYGRTVTKILEIPGVVSGAPQAAAYATVYLNRGKNMTVMGQIVTSTIYDVASQLPAPCWKVRGGDPLKVQNFLAPAGSVGNVVDEITTFEIKTTQYDDKAKNITITPKDWDSGLEPTFARLGQ
jgi:hypothetical protein